MKSLWSRISLIAKWKCKGWNILCAHRIQDLPCHLLELPTCVTDFERVCTTEDVVKHPEVQVVVAKVCSIFTHHFRMTVGLPLTEGHEGLLLFKGHDFKRVRTCRRQELHNRTHHSNVHHGVLSQLLHALQSFLGLEFVELGKGCRHLSGERK